MDQKQKASISKDEIIKGDCPVYSLCAEDDLMIIFAGLENGKIVIYHNWYNGGYIPRQTISAHQMPIYNMEYDQKNSFLISGVIGEGVRIWKNEQKRYVFHQEIQGPAPGINLFYINSDANLLFTSIFDKGIVIWKLQENSKYE